MNTYLKVAREAAEVAGSIITSGYENVGEVTFKSDIDMVTDVDKRSEDAILEILMNAFPNHDFIAEESGIRNVRSDYQWYIDPLDGTTNFVHGIPILDVSIALYRGDEPLVAIVCNPLTNEYFEAIQGGGAYLCGKSIRVSRRSQLGDALLGTGFPYDAWTTNHDNTDHVKHFVKTVRDIRRMGAAALDLAYVAAGRLDGFWEAGLEPWDVAAGALIIQEARGQCTGFLGGPLDLNGSNIVASNGLIHKEMLDVLSKGHTGIILP